MKLAIDLSTAQVEQLQERAKSLGVQPEELARALGKHCVRAQCSRSS